MRLLAILLVTSCGVRAPAPIDLAALVGHRGVADARLDLEIRIVSDPSDVQARLAAAELDAKLQTPSDAIEQYEAVERWGGPLGTRWHASDKQRFAMLLASRGLVRLERNTANALYDLQRAQKLGGVALPPAELELGRVAVAITQLRHVDGPERSKGRAALAAMANPVWAGAKASASPEQHAVFGVWLWASGAKREAYDQLAAWHDHATANPGFAAAYRRALEWWSPDAAVEARSASASGSASGSVSASESASGSGSATGSASGSASGSGSVFDAQPAVPAEPADDALPADLRADAAAQYAHARAVEIISSGQRGADRSVACTCDLSDITAYPELVRVARAFRRDPAIAERLGRDVILRAVDSTLARATIAALFDALGDPARARTLWLGASEESDESAIVAGYAAAAARAGDGDAALVIAVSAAASSGDPAVVWIDVARALLRGNRSLDALTALRSAVDLAGANTLPDALELASETSRLVGRTEQADRFATQRAHLWPPAAGHAAQHVELAELTQHAPNASVLAAAWVASRGDPHDVELRAALVATLERDDPRRATLETELVLLAADRDPDRGLSAALSLK
ncbi:MAG: hypothetical protein ABI591_08695 [Kofleriaceae bacterium]